MPPLHLPSLITFSVFGETYHDTSRGRATPLVRQAVIPEQFKRLFGRMRVRFSRPALSAFVSIVPSTSSVGIQAHADVGTGQSAQSKTERHFRLVWSSLMDMMTSGARLSPGPALRSWYSWPTGCRVVNNDDGDSAATLADGFEVVDAPISLLEFSSTPEADGLL